MIIYLLKHRQAQRKSGNNKATEKSERKLMLKY